MKTKELLHFIFLVGLTNIASAKTTLPDTVFIDEVKIMAKINYAPIGTKAEKMDSSVIQQNISSSVSDLLIMSSPLSVKSYGNGGLATISFRGTSANHTQVMWNGMNINSSMLGQSDLALLPVFFSDNIIINYGSSSMQLTSGGIGGSINLENLPDWNNRLSSRFLHTVGSFGAQGDFITLNAGNNKIQSKTSIFRKLSENNFKYKSDKHTVSSRKFAATDMKGFLQELYFKPNTSNVFSIKAWMQKSYRELPSIILVDEDQLNTYQKDNSVRTIFEWRKKMHKLSLTARSGIFYNTMRYTNKLIHLTSINRSTEYKEDVLASIYVSKNLNLRFNSTFNIFQIKSDNYLQSKPATLLTNSAILNSKFKKNLSASFTIRYEVFDREKISGILPMIGVNYKPLFIEHTRFYLNIAKNNRFPSLNDLFWNPGGNPNLKPEKSLSSEVGFEKQIVHNSNNKISMFLSYYQSFISNWIAWQPYEGSANYWVPVNYKEVINKGIEAKIKGNYDISNFKIITLLYYNYTKTENAEIYRTANQAVLGKQLIYVPKNRINSIFTLHYGSNQLNVNYSYSGKRFITADNTEYLPQYALVDFSLSKNLHYAKFYTCLEFKINNITNQQYQSVAWYPMPGINYEFKVLISFKEKAL